MKRALLALATGLALSVSAHAVPLLSEGFDDVSALTGWTYANTSTPGLGLEPDWFQGNSGVFVAQAGADDAYIASNFNAAPAGGYIGNTLATPYFSMESDVMLTFWARGSTSEGFLDHFAVFFQTGFDTPVQVLADTTALADWTQYTVNVAGLGAASTGRFGFNYFGDADTSDYFGIDTVAVVGADAGTVPEPSTTVLLGGALLGLAFNRRRQAGAKA